MNPPIQTYWKVPFEWTMEQAPPGVSDRLMFEPITDEAWLIGIAAFRRAGYLEKPPWERLLS